MRLWHRLRITGRWALMALLLAAVMLPEPAARGESTSLSVRYRSNGTIYLDAGRAAGLEVGDRLEVTRSGETIAEIEVIFVADYSASCRILREDGTIQPGDSARMMGEKARSGQDAAEGQAEAEGEPESSQDETAFVPPVPERAPAAPRRPATRVSGALTLDWESFTDDSPAGRDFDRTSARLSLRGRNLGGTPLSLRIRTRMQQNRRTRAYSNGARESEDRDRLYELALIYEPPQGRFSFRAGRIGSSPFVGVGLLDGVLGQVALSRSFAVGGFYGSRPLIEEFGFESYGQKYGVFTRFSGGAGPRAPFELYLAGIREEGDVDVSREYVVLETRYTPVGRWSFYQRAELDLNNGWREELSDSSSQLSNFSLTATTRISERSRFSISYNLFERYRTEESRSIPEELFDDLRRQGLRANLMFGRPRGLNFSLNAGYRQRDGEGDTSSQDTVSWGLGVRHPNVAAWGLSLSADVFGYSNPYTQGYVASGRAAKRFGRGHEVSLVLGGRLSSDRVFDDEEDRTNEWVRLGFWFELPANLFARGELELLAGDDLKGQRINAGLGYRF